MGRPLKIISREKIKKDPDLTTFQKKVLIAVTEIPEGKVRSYAWVARKAGYPGASRAVGQALKKNPYAPQVPCHRVVASDGSIGGYSRGVARKKKLLEKEGIKWS
jgi:methylated-DNA-[protein]-cysteine S-methyltransferase